MNYAAKITATAVSQPNVVLALSLCDVQESRPLAIGSSEGTSPASRCYFSLVGCDPHGQMLNFLTSTPLSLDANDDDK